VDQAKKKIALLHRHPPELIRETNAAFPYLCLKGIDVRTYKRFNRTSTWDRFVKSFFWIFYAPLLVIGRGYDVIYCDDSYPFYPALVKLASPRSKVVVRIGDLHLMYYTSGLVYWFLHLFELIGWESANRIIAISKPMAGYIYDELWLATSNHHLVDVVLDPVDSNDFPIVNGRNKGTVMFHGLLTRNKNIDILIEAAWKMPETNFVIVGDGPDRYRLGVLAPMNVEFAGWVPFYRIRNEIRNCAVGVALRSNNPGNEYVVTSPFLQYGVMGKPCLVTRRLVFGDYEWQFSGVDELVSKLKILLKRPEEGMKLREFILEHHAADKIADQIWSLLLS